MSGRNLIDNLAQDFRFSIRQLRKNPGFAITALLMIALGICASVSIFAFVDAALIRPLPYRDASRLVGVYETVKMFPQSNLSYFDFVDWKKQNTSFNGFDAYNGSGATLQTPSGVIPLPGTRVTAGFFRTLGVTPLIGRDFQEGEDSTSAQATAMLSYSAWQTRYGGRADVLGTTVTLNDTPTVIIGVLPKEFHFAPAEPADFWMALRAAGSCELRRSCHNLYGVARLKDGIPFEAALADVRSIAKQLERQYPDMNRDQGATLAPLTEVIVGNIRPILLVLFGGAFLLLVIASVNVASLLLVRSESRRREIAVRAALGASASRMASQFIIEGVVLVAAGSALGILGAWWLMQVLTTLIPANMMASMTYLHGIALNGRVLAFAAGVSLLAGVLFSITPALRLASPRIREGLAEGSRGSAGLAWRRLGSKLVVIELATAMILLVSAGLLTKSLNRLLHVELGFQPDHLVAMQVGAPQARYGKAAQAIAFEREVKSRVEQLPGVASVAVSTGVPISHNGNTMWFRVLGRPWHGEHLECPERDVSANYFSTIGAKLIRGRYFTESEDASKPPVAMINQAFARQHFPGEEPVGKQITYVRDDVRPIEIVGIVEDVREGPLDAAIPPVLYIPFNQDPSSFFSLIVRGPGGNGTTQAEESLLPVLVSLLHGMDPGVVTLNGMTLRDRIQKLPSAYLKRSSAWLVGGFAATALLLAMIGLYGVVAYSVSQRTREIGVRMALGAGAGSVCQMILREAGVLVAIGVVSGLACSVAAATFLRKMLFGVEGWDVPTLAGVAVLLSLAALAASYVPARRAAAVNPVVALRSE
ncbi:MAG: ABC transporter permease [Bryobacteraceae bacterium]